MNEVGRTAIEAAKAAGEPADRDISRREVGMLISRGRLHARTRCLGFQDLARGARSLAVVPESAAVAARAATLEVHGDPADGIIAAAAMERRAVLVTSDRRLPRSRAIPSLR